MQVVAGTVPPSERCLPPATADRMSDMTSAGRADVTAGSPKETAVTTQKSRLDFIDILRALAVLSVFGLHVRAFWLGPDQVSSNGPLFVLDRILAQGAAGVDLFVVLSGFCLTYPLVRGRAAGVAQISTRRFYKRRAIRILPAYYASVALVLALLQVPKLQERMVARPPDATDVIAHLFLVQPLFPDRIGAINGPTWSISLEVALYLCFPLTLLLLRRWGWSRLIAGTVLLAVGWHILGKVLEQTSPDGIAANFTYLLPAHLFQFVLGMLAADLVARPRQRQQKLALACLLLGAPLGASGTILGEALMRTLGWGVAGFGLTVFASSVLARRQMKPWSPSRVGTRIGLVSFSFYLLHQPFLLLTAPVARALTSSPVALYVIAATLGLAVMYLVALIFFRLVERPFLVSGGMKDAIKPDAHRS